MRSVTYGAPMANFHQPGGLVTETIDANTGYKPGPWTSHATTELFLPGTSRRRPRLPPQRLDRRGERPAWQDGCVGPEKTVGALDLRHVEAAYPTWQKYDNSWAARAARGPGVRGGPKGTHTAFFYGTGFYPFGQTWGGIFAPTALCPLAPPPTPPPCDNFLGLFCPPPPSGEPGPNPSPTPSHHPPKTPRP
jgi:hypothetical protein